MLKRKRYDRDYFQGILHRETKRSQRNHHRLEQLLPLRPNGRLLEIGFGAGGFLEAAAQHYEIQGIDVSRWAVQHAPRHLRRRVRVQDFPISIEVAPRHHLVDLPSMGDADRATLAGLLVDVLGRLDRLWGRPLPYMLWLNQHPDGWFNVEIVSPWRQPGVMRFIAAAEVASTEYFNEVVPEDLAATLRDL